MNNSGKLLELIQFVGGIVAVLFFGAILLGAGKGLWWAALVVGALGILNLFLFVRRLYARRHRPEVETSHG